MAIGLTGEFPFIRTNRSAAIAATGNEPHALESTELHAPSPRLARNVLASIAGVLIVLSFAVETANHLTGSNGRVLPKLVKAFSVDLELNVPVFFSMLILLLASALLASVALLSKRTQKGSVFHWVLLSGGFLFMAFDEIVSAHEKLIEPMRGLLKGSELGIFYYAWVIPAVVLLLVLMPVFLRFWWRLPSKTRWAFAAGGTIYLTGAVVLEMIDGNYFESHGRDMIYIALTTLEESLEMFGLIVFIWALVDHIGSLLRKVEIRFS